MDGSVYIFFYQFFAEQDSVFVVIAFPWHVRYDYVIAERQFAVVCCRTVGNRFFRFYMVAFINNRHLIYACSLVGAHVFLQFIMVDFARFVSAYFDESQPLARTTSPACLASIITPESHAALYSIPVPTSGACVLNSGTA